MKQLSDADTCRLPKIFLPNICSSYYKECIQLIKLKVKYWLFLKTTWNSWCYSEAQSRLLPIGCICWFGVSFVQPMLRQKVSEENLLVLTNDDSGIHIPGINLGHRLSASATGRQNSLAGNRHHSVNLCFPKFQHLSDGCDFRTESETGAEIDTDSGIDVAIGRADGGTDTASREFILQGEAPADGSGSLDQFFSRLFHGLTPNVELSCGG